MDFIDWDTDSHFGFSTGFVYYCPYNLISG
jgi:hypothetical protein